MDAVVEPRRPSTAISTAIQHETTFYNYSAHAASRTECSGSTALQHSTTSTASTAHYSYTASTIYSTLHPVSVCWLSFRCSGSEEQEPRKMLMHICHCVIAALQNANHTSRQPSKDLRNHICGGSTKLAIKSLREPSMSSSIPNEESTLAAFEHFSCRKNSLQRLRIILS